MPKINSMHVADNGNPITIAYVEDYLGEFGQEVMEWVADANYLNGFYVFVAIEGVGEVSFGVNVNCRTTAIFSYHELFLHESDDDAYRKFMQLPAQYRDDVTKEAQEAYDRVFSDNPELVKLGFRSQGVSAVVEARLAYARIPREGSVELFEPGSGFRLRDGTWMAAEKDAGMLRSDGNQMKQNYLPGQIWLDSGADVELMESELMAVISIQRILEDRAAAAKDESD
ncbi:MAG: hypothetical protein PF483_06155 [Halothiobacillus sp.]|jgi:hypothetical protein|nr:hypothetical protein [Halothiobacillus sp.]